jgi:hypothetical protein
MAISIREAIAGASTLHDGRDFKYRTVVRPVFQILDKKGNVLIESTDEWEMQELFRLIRGGS